MIKKFKCYFAHPYPSIGSPEEIEILEELKNRRVDVVNPFDDEDDFMLTKHGRTSYYPDPPYKMARGMWIKDLRQVAKCDMILVYVPDGMRLSGGCGIEMFHAWQLKKFIQVISNHWHPAIAYVLDSKGNQFFNTVEQWKKHKQVKWD